MKKFIAVIMCLVLSCGVFIACSKDDKKSDSGKTTKTTTEIATSDATISGSQAIALLKSYSKKELSLSDVKEDYQFMLSTVGTQIDGQKYVRAEAGAMVENGKDDDGNKTYTKKEYGVFFISFDGSKILIQKKDGKYDTIKIDNEHLKKIETTAHEHGEDCTHG